MAAGVAVAAAALGGVVGGSTITADRSLRTGARAAARRPAQLHRNLAGHAPRRRLPRARPSGDRRRWRTLGPGPPARTLAFPELNLGGQLVELGAVDDPRRWLRLASGRLPRTCVANPLRGRPGGRNGRWTRYRSPACAWSSSGARRRRCRSRWARSRASTHQSKGGPPPVLVAGGVSPISALPVLSALYRGLRMDDADPAADAARLADRRPARPPGRRRAQRPAPGHVVWPHRADRHARWRCRAPTPSRRGDCSWSAAARRRSCSASCCSPRPACAATPAPSGPGSSATAPGSASCGRSRGSRPPGSPSPARSWAPRWPRWGWRSPPTGPASARPRCCATRSHRGPGIAAIARGLGRGCGRARRRRAHGRRRPAPRARARPRPGGPGGRRRRRACGRPRQRELDHAGRRLRSAAGAAAGPRRGRRGDRDRAPGRTAAAPGRAAACGGARRACGSR